MQTIYFIIPPWNPCKAIAEMIVLPLNIEHRIKFLIKISIFNFFKLIVFIFSIFNILLLIVNIDRNIGIFTINILTTTFDNAVHAVL